METKKNQTRKLRAVLGTSIYILRPTVPSLVLLLATATIPNPIHCNLESVLRL